jgi:hypothetical protein
VWRHFFFRRPNGLRRKGVHTRVSLSNGVEWWAQRVTRTIFRGSTFLLRYFFFSFLSSVLFIYLSPFQGRDRSSSWRWWNSTQKKELRRFAYVHDRACVCVWLPLFEEEEWGWAALGFGTQREVALPGFRPTIKNAVKFSIFFFFFLF